MSRSSENKLDSRLRMCADFVRKGAKLADIGTDHAYLPVWLCRIGFCPSAVAADINPEPLSRGTSVIAQAGLNKVITTRLSDGLSKIQSDEADDIVIAGMGGELISKIISECGFARDSSKHFILQPMTKSELLVEWLCKNGFEIIKQDCCVAANKCYTVILAEYTGAFAEREELYYYLAELHPENNDVHMRFVNEHIARLLKKANGNAHFAELAELLKAAAGGTYD